jgi:hypothetical protein
MILELTKKGEFKNEEGLTIGMVSKDALLGCPENNLSGLIIQHGLEDIIAADYIQNIINENKLGTVIIRRADETKMRIALLMIIKAGESPDECKDIKSDIFYNMIGEGIYCESETNALAVHFMASTVMNFAQYLDAKIENGDKIIVKLINFKYVGERLEVVAGSYQGVTVIERDTLNFEELEECEIIDLSLEEFLIANPELLQQETLVKLGLAEATPVDNVIEADFNSCSDEQPCENVIPGAQQLVGNICENIIANDECGCKNGGVCNCDPSNDNCGCDCPQ